jgi:hypothetical protein
LNATTLVKSGGTSTQYLMADGTTSTLTNPVTGTGTTNYVSKWTGTSTQAISQIFDNATTVGIGAPTTTLSTAYKLGVNGTLAIKGPTTGTAYLFFTDTLSSGNTPAWLSYNYANQIYSMTAAGGTGVLQFASGAGTERMRITATGDVGIGNTSPAYKLDITGTLRNTTGAAFATSSGNVLIGTTTDGGSYKLDVQGALRNTTGANFATSSGNVVIGGTGTGSFKLDVTGSGRFSTNLNVGTGATNSAIVIDGGSGSGQGASMTFRTASTDIAYVGRSSFVTSGTINTNGLSFGTLSSSINFLTVAGGGFVERFRIDSATGNVGVSTASPTERLHVTGRIRATTIDSTATGMNMLYADATGVIKKAAVPSGSSGTVTSVATGFGLSGGTITTTGTLLVDSASVATRERVQKGVDSVATLANTKVGGTGITGYFPKWTGTGTQDTSQLFQLGRNIGIGTASPTYRLHLPDAGATANQAMIAGTIFGSDGNGITISPNSSNITIKGGQGNGSIYSGTISSVARWGINTTSISDAVLSINGDVKIVTVDSTSTARNMLYQDANGMIKKSAVPTGLTMADDVITASGSWVATKDAGSGTTINNVAYTTDGTTKMVTVDGNFYIAETSFTENAWNEIGTIPSGFRPSKTVNWNNNFIVSGAEYEQTGGTDFTGSLEWTYAQIRIKDTGVLEVIGSITGSNTIAAGGTAYIIVPFQVSYIIK